MKITEIKEGVRNKNRVNLYSDGEFLFAVYLETAVKNGLRVGIELNEAQLEEMRKEDGTLYAMQTALDYVSRKMRTQKEIERKLKEKEIDADVIARTIHQLLELGYIDDALYARMYTEELMQRYGKRVIEQKLFLRGIDKETVRAAMEETENQADALKLHLERLNTKYENDPKRRDKTIRALLSKGFEYDEIRRAMNGEDE